MSNEVPEKAYKEIERIIGSDQSVVGIDAKKTHIIIIHMLQQLDSRLDAIEKRLKQLEK
ncbi:MAG: hypothetical protein JJU37_15175 [Balneolaceae bacterium]|nr:hypothetical protein [Balneolaceae bacterium]